MDLLINLIQISRIKLIVYVLGLALIFVNQSGHATSFQNENNCDVLRSLLIKAAHSRADQTISEASFSPRFLTYEQVLALHKIQVEKFGGSTGIKDDGLLRSALAQPEGGFGDHYHHKDLYEMGAAYLFHLAKNHAFVDGNKRVAALASTVFLEINGLKFTASEKAFEKLVLDTAKGLVTKDQIADFFRRNSQKIAQP